MNTRARTALHQAVKASSAPVSYKQQQHREKKAEKMQQENSKLMDSAKISNRCLSRRERKIALQHDVDKLKRKLRHEENVHRALERAFTRPLGSLPRLPPYLPQYTLELLAEVAVLEEEVVRLEEQVVNFRQGLYQEAVYISSSKKPVEDRSDLDPPHNLKRVKQSKKIPQVSSKIPVIDNNPWTMQNGLSSKCLANGRKVLNKPNSCLSVLGDHRGKENHLNSNSPMKNPKQSPKKKAPRIQSGSVEKWHEAQVECKSNNRGSAEENLCVPSDVTALDGNSGPNAISEDILKCLLSIFSRMGIAEDAGAEPEMVPSISGFIDNPEDTLFRDPYGICSKFGKRDVGPYKHFLAVEEDTLDPKLITGLSFLIQRLKILLRKLGLVDLGGLTHQQKLAFWINIYNSCMMNAFLEHGIPANPQMVVALMQKAMVNVGGHLLSAMTIEHFILRLPYLSKYTFPKGIKNEELMMRSVLGLDWPEPLVTFALSCGSWSSPSVRVYTASQVENELETAKREYLQASVGISMKNGMGIPKLLDWYLLDFAKDVESLMDWICLQLPSRLRNEAVKCLERGRREAPSHFIQVMPHEFSFRYLLAT